MKTTETNKLIAEFMGTNPININYAQNNRAEFKMYGIIECIVDDINEKHYFYPEEMLFHESWDWLMPVVEKIENTTDGTISIESDNAHISGCFELHIAEHSKIESAYTAVVEFIKWYNENK